MAKSESFDNIYENSEKTTGCLISRKATLHVQPPFFRTFSAPFFCTTTRGNFQKLPRYTFYGKKMSYLFLMFAFFPLPLIFTSVPASTSRPFSFPHRRYKIFMLLFKQQMCPLLFIPCFSSLSLFLSLSLAVLSRTFSFSLSFSFSIYVLNLCT